MANRLGTSTSPYLQQHADNPVDWWPWGDEAFAAARERDVPVFLSVGYSACHWCHVMAHESFEDAGDRGAAQRRLRVRQGRPRGAAGRRRRLHGGDAGDDRSGRLADERDAHARAASPSSRGRTSHRLLGMACRRSARCCLPCRRHGESAVPRSSRSAPTSLEHLQSAGRLDGAVSGDAGSRRAGP